MRSLPLSLIGELESEFASLGHLIDIDMGGAVYRFTDKDMDVVYDWGGGPVTYQSRGVEFDAAQYSLLPKVDSISFEIDNVSLEMSAIIMGSETRGRACTIYRAAFNSYLGVTGIDTLFVGTLDKVEADHQRARFEVLNHFYKWNTPTPRRRHSVTCPWTFKDTATCRYAGVETWCDRSWDRCTALGNTANNGSFRWLTDLMDKQVKWGRP